MIIPDMSTVICVAGIAGKKVNQLYGPDINPVTQITMTPAGTYAIYTAVTTVLQRR